MSTKSLRATATSKGGLKWVSSVFGAVLQRARFGRRHHADALARYVAHVDAHVGDPDFLARTDRMAPSFTVSRSARRA